MKTVSKSKSTKPETGSDEKSPFKELAKLGEIDTGSGTIHVRVVQIEGRGDEKPRKTLDIRQWIDGKKYTGWGKGASIPLDQTSELKDILDENEETIAKFLKKAKK